MSGLKVKVGKCASKSHMAAVMTLRTVLKHCCKQFFFSGPLGGGICPPNTNNFKQPAGCFSHFLSPQKQFPPLNYNSRKNPGCKWQNLMILRMLWWPNSTRRTLNCIGKLPDIGHKCTLVVRMYTCTCNIFFYSSLSYAPLLLLVSVIFALFSFTCTTASVSVRVPQVLQVLQLTCCSLSLYC